MDIYGIILAAGEGTRFQSDVPKYLQKLAGETLLTHSMRILKSVGVNKVVVVLGAGKEKAPVLDKGVRIVEQKKRKGTADAFYQALKVLPHRGNVLLLYIDTPLIKYQTLKRLISLHEKEKSEITLLTMRIEKPRGYGRIIRDNRGRITGIKEEDLLTLEEKGIKEVNVGVYIFKTSDFLIKALTRIKPQGEKNEKYLTEVVSFYSRKNLKISSLILSDPQEGLGVNSREELIAVSRILYLRNAHYHIKNGVTVIDPENTYIEKDVKIGKDTVIYPLVYIESGVDIGKNCSIGPSTRIRKGSYISDDVSIGNFVEIVRSKIGSCTKIRHFSYIGDAVVGRNVNIGAGTVTANYDGRRKNKTVIDDFAFIGSNTTIVAPVKIGKGAVTGAGSVVVKNRDVPESTVVVGVPAKILRRKNDG